MVTFYIVVILKQSQEIGLDTQLLTRLQTLRSFIIIYVHSFVCVCVCVCVCAHVFLEHISRVVGFGKHVVFEFVL